MGKQEGYTFIEVCITISIISIIAIIGMTGYIGLHFLFKYW